MENKFDKNDNKKLLAYICAQNQFQPSIIESKEIKNISIKDVNLKEWIAMKSQDEYKALKEQVKNIDAKINYIDHKGQEQNTVIKNVNDMMFEISNNEFTAITNENGYKQLFSTTDFMEMYLEALRELYPVLDDHLHAVHDLAEDVGKPLIYVTKEVDIVDRRLPAHMQEGLEFEDLEKGMSIHMEGRMYSPDMEQCPEEVDTLVLGKSHSEFDSFDITVVEGEDAIYVSYDIWPILEMEREPIEYEPEIKVPVYDENYIYEYYRQQLANLEKEPNFEEGEIFPGKPPQFPGEEFPGPRPQMPEILADPIYNPGPEILIDPIPEFPNMNVDHNYKDPTMDNEDIGYDHRPEVRPTFSGGELVLDDEYRDR